MIIWRLQSTRTAPSGALQWRALKPEGEIMSSLGRVLVVDDEPHVALTLHDVLVSCGYHVRVAATGQEALSLLSTFEPDMILLDLGLPGMRGEAVLEQLVRE